MSSTVICISGPSGAGKDFLLGTLNPDDYTVVQMHTTRPSRGANDKPNISNEEMTRLNDEGLLLGHHVNATGFVYAYKIKDVQSAIMTGKVVILEINPETQSDLPQELVSKGISFGGWVALFPDLKYIAENMVLREHGSRLEREGGEKAPVYTQRPTFEEILSIVGADEGSPTDIFDLGEIYIGEDFGKRIQMARDFLSQYAALGTQLTLFPVGWDNRLTMAGDFLNLLSSLSSEAKEPRKLK